MMASASHVGVVVASAVILALVFFYVPLKIRRLTRSLRARNVLREPHTRNAYGSLYDAYKPEHIDFEFFMTTRRGLAVVAEVLARATASSALIQAGQAYRSSNTRAFETFVFPAFYTRACRVPDTHQ